MRQNQVSLRAPLLWALFPWMIGYWLASRFDLFDADGYAWITLACAVLSSIFNRFIPWLIFFLAAAISAGSCYYLIATSFRKPDEALQSMPIRELELSLQVTKPFDRKDSYGRLSGIAEIVSAPVVRSDLSGKRVYFQLTSSNESTSISQGAILRTIGLLVPRPSSSANDFERYLDHSGVSYFFGRGSIREITKDANEFSIFCQSSNKKLESILRLGEDGDHALTDVAVAMMLGKKAVLQEERKKRYVTAGVMHLFAISGLHVGVIGASLAFIFRRLPIPKWTEALLGLICLFLYVQITGGSPSATRAFTMVAFWWGSWLIGRPASSLPALVSAAFATLLMNPLQLWDLGFQLSYIVVASIILYGVPLAFRFQSVWEPWAYLPRQDHSILQRWTGMSWKWFTSVLGVSFAATLSSAPLVIEYFGVFSPGAVLLNAFLVLLAGFVIVCGFISLVLGLLSMTFVSSMVNQLQSAIIWIMDELVQIFLAVPGLFYRLEIDSSGISTMIVLATLTLFIVLVRRIRFAALWICLLPLGPLILLVTFFTSSTGD